jgi:hypothetical protein
MTENITYGMLEQKLAWDHVPMQELSSEVMDSLLPAYGSSPQGTPGRLYCPQDGIQAYVIPERGTPHISDDMVADGIIVGYAPLNDCNITQRGLDRGKINEVCESLADFMVMTYLSEGGCVVEGTVARDDHPAKPSPREAFFRVVDFRYMLQRAVEYVAGNIQEGRSVDSLVGEFSREVFSGSGGNNPRATLG